MAAMRHVHYKIDRKVADNFIPLRLKGDDGCVNLVSIYNMLTLKGWRGGYTFNRSENLIMQDLKEKLEARILLFEDLPTEEANEARNTLASIRTQFCLMPRLTGHQDFEMNGSRLLCKLLDLPVFHAWVIDPLEKNYGFFSHCSHSDLADYYCNKSDHLDVCKRLLNCKHTSFGIETLHEELNDHDTALLFCRDRLDVVYKRNGAIFVYVVDEIIRKQISEAVWMLLEEDEQSIYFSDKFIPVKEQPHKTKAMEWYRELLAKLRNAMNAEEEERGQSSEQRQSDDVAGSSVPSEATGTSAEAGGSHHRQDNTVNKSPQQEHSEAAEIFESTTGILTTGKGAKEQERKKSSQQMQSDDADRCSIPNEATGKWAEAGGSHHHQDSTANKSPQQAHPVDAESFESTAGILNTGKGAGAMGSHHSDGGEVVVSDQDSRVKKSPQEAHSSDGAAKCSDSTVGILTPENEAEVNSDKETPDDDERAAVPNISGSQDAVLKGDASDFLNFLETFKDNDCSNHYFEGVVAAFASQRPLFYVPYDFIISVNEPLALKLEENYSGICEDLKKAVDTYLSKNGVDSPDAVLKVLGRPTKSIQCFVEFVESIVLHEHYDVFGEGPQALPSYDSRRMGLGFLSSIVAKFKTGRCWGGKWSEANMKVKNGNKFVIDLEDDCELTADTGYLDLTKFCEIVLDRLKFNGKMLPFFDELAEDHMLINDCFGDPLMWPRFLILISYPLALKPPLVRASFICNIYIAGDGNSSGNPPQYRPLYDRRNCVNWRLVAQKHELLSQIYYYLHQKSTKYKYLINHWSPTHWHVFKFSRHFIQHVLRYTKGEDLNQKIQDISVLDILLSLTISKAIGKSVRFLVLHCGVEGIFSCAWRQYIGSDYADKPNLEDARAGDVVQGLLHNIEQKSIEQKSGYMYSEISLYSEPQHVSIITHDADLIQLQTFLNDIGFVCNHNGDHLQYGSVKLSKRICLATEECAEHGVIVVEGPYSVEFDSLYDVLLTLDLLTQNLPPTL